MSQARSTFSNVLKLDILDCEIIECNMQRNLHEHQITETSQAANRVAEFISLFSELEALSLRNTNLQETGAFKTFKDFSIL